METHSLFDWISVLGPIILSWPLVIAFALLFFHRPLFNLLKRVSDQNVQKAKIGPLEIEEIDQPYVKSLKLLLTSFVSTKEMECLKKLDQKEGALSYDSDPLYLTAARRLHDIDFIKTKGDLDEIPDQGDLQNHAELTEKGKDYLKLYDHFSRSSSKD
jgi:hypothetical protein